jgi:hypothetical protein
MFRQAGGSMLSSENYLFHFCYTDKVLTNFIKHYFPRKESTIYGLLHSVLQNIF